MSYITNIPTADIGKYREINDWEEYISERVNTVNDNPEFNPEVDQIIFRRKIFKVPASISFTLAASVEFQECFFAENVLFDGSSFGRSISFFNCKFDKDFRISANNTFKGEFNLHISLKGTLYIEGGEFQGESQFGIGDSSRVVLQGGNFKNLTIGHWGGGTILRELHIQANNIDGCLVIQHNKSQIETLKLFGSSKAHIAIEDIKVNLLLIFRFRNDKSLRIMNVRPLDGKQPTEFSITDSYLGKAEFYSIDFSGFSIVQFVNAHFVDCSFINIKWHKNIQAFKGRTIALSDDEKKLPEKIKAIENSWDSQLNDEQLEILMKDKSVVEYYNHLKEVFRQLKYSLGKQGDIINEQFFHSKEMTAFDKTIFWTSEPDTKLIVKLSHLLSNFGQSPTRPLLALLVGHGVLFATLFVFGFEDKKFQTCEELSVFYFKLINPLRKTDDLLPDLFIIIDILMRIWSSYMIYNFIRATRRFIK